LKRLSDHQLYTCTTSNTSLNVSKLETEPNLTSQTEKSLYLACQQGDLKAVESWINYYEKEELPREDGNGRFPIHYAAKNGHVEIVDYLADHFGYNVNQKSLPTLLTEVPEEKTALHFAVENNQLEVVKVLLKHGVDVNDFDQNRKTPIEIAEEKGFLELLSLMCKHHLETSQQLGK
jgi:ankyrin repeat protein